jgi:hypothetical protein
MPRARRAAVAVAILVTLTSFSTSAPVAGLGLSPRREAAPAGLAWLPTGGVAIQEEPIERQIGQTAKSAISVVRQSFRTLGWMFGKATNWWSKWLRQAAPYLALAVVTALADTALLDAWRQEGFRALATYIPMMLYVYVRLLFSSGVRLVPKLFLLVALIYGVVRNDLNPDGHLAAARPKDFAKSAEDFLLIIIATRYFVYSCPEYLVQTYAERAVMLRRRMSALARRAR